MYIAGLQKLTLLDFPGRVACTVFTYGCDLRCPFCHNASLVLTDGQDPCFVPYEEIIGFLEKRKGILDGVVITGGEPTLQRGLAAMMHDIKDMGYAVKLDTNGTRPDVLEEITKQGLCDHIAMDIKNSPARYAETAGLADIDMKAVTDSIDIIMGSGTEYEFRTTLVKGLHTPDSLKEAAALIKGAKRYYLQQFKDSGMLIAPEGLSAFDKEEMYMFAEAVRPLIPAVSVRGVD